MMKPLSNLPQQSEPTLNLEEQLFKYLKHWKWIVLSVIIALVGAYFIIRYSVPRYGVSATILIKDDRKGGSELDVFSDLGIITGGKNTIDNEIAILSSRTLSQNVVRDLEFNVSYFVEGRIISPEAYKNSPIKVLFTDKKEAFYHKDATFIVTPISEKEFELSGTLKDNRRKYSFGQKIDTAFGTFIIVNNFSKTISGNPITVQITSVARKAASYNARLLAETTGKKTSIIKLSITDPIPEKGIDFLNGLVGQYNKDAAEDKNEIAQNTSEFIHKRLGIISKELDSVERDAESFKKANRLTDLSSNASLSLSSSAEYDRQVAENETELKVTGYMLDLVKKITNDDLIPANVLSETGNSSASGLISEYNKLILERKRILTTATESNPMVKSMTAQIEGLRESIKESLNNTQTSLKITQRDLMRQEAIFSGQVGQVPTNERKFKIIARQQQIKESLYLYLLQKREETAISLAVTSPKAKVIDAAYPTGMVSPNAQLIYLLALLIGLLLPVGIIFLLDLLDNKIHSRHDIEKSTSIPYLGDIPLSDYTDGGEYDSRSPTAESFRIILTNLEFMLAQTKPGVAKTIFITSTMPKEGKTFISVNVAKTLALYGKKVLLIGMDLRHPKFAEYLDIKSNVGVSNYLSSDKYALKDIVFKHENFDDLWVMPSGAIPPNPAELLNSGKVAEIFEQFKSEFDYIIVDTAPVSLVTDTLLLKQYADVFVYAVRANYLKKAALAVPESLHRDNKLPNMSILLNGLDYNKSYGYGYGYGYVYGYGYGKPEEKTPWYKKFLKK